VIADALTNPRLKGLRDLYGTPDDKRFALPKDSKIDVPGFERTPARAAGKRLLGLRIDGGEPVFTVTLFNAGGNDNGAAIGAATVRYHARQSDKGWRVEVVETLAP
jgi:hypothetical protein